MYGITREKSRNKGKTMTREPHPRPKGFFGIRHLQIALIFIGLTVTLLNRINLSEAIVAMTDRASHVETIYLTIAEKGTVSGAFFWGYAIANIPGGILAKKIGPIKTLALCMFLASVLNCLLPIMAIKTGFYGLYISRILQGLVQGPIYPSVNTLMAKWAVPQERGFLFSFAFSGAQLGTIVIMIAGGAIATSEGGWPFIFYASGICGIAWSALCLFVGADSPAVHRSISKEERDYIEYNFEGSSLESAKMPVPWRSIFCSGPVWAMMVANVGYGWGFWSLITLTPTYLNGVYNFNMQQNGILSALPYVAMFTMTLIFSPIIDCLSNHGISTVVIRKVMNSVAFWGSGLSLLALGFLFDSAQSSIICLIFAMGTFSAIYVGCICNHIDLSPNFSGVLMGITNTVSNIGSLGGPSAAGVIISDESSQDQWKIFFLVSGLVLIVSNGVFIFLGAGSIQPWNYGKVVMDSEKTFEHP